MTKIIDELIAEIKTGNAIWTKPWTTALPRNHTTGRLYSGLNVWALMYSQMRSNYSHAIWAGYGQWSKAGYQVQKGEHGTEIITFIPPKKDDNGTILNRGFFKPSRVFNIAQTDFPIETLEAPNVPIASAEALIERLSPKMRRGDCAYSPGADTIYMPPITAFTDGESYYASFFHELTHWTGHSSRLNRAGIVDSIRFGSERYAREELIAEIGACLISQFCNTITDKQKANSAAYLRGWIANCGEIDIDQSIMNALEDAMKAFEFVRNKA